MRKRNIRMSVRLSEDEFAIVKPRVDSTGLSIEACLRNLLSGFLPREKPDEEFYAAMRMLAGIANNINQLARHTNMYDSDIARILYNQADEWGRLQVELRERFLLPEKI